MRCEDGAMQRWIQNFTLQKLSIDSPLRPPRVNDPARDPTPLSHGHNAVLGKSWIWAPS